MHYHIRNGLQDATIWTWPSSKGQKGQTKVNIELVWDFDVENISVKLRNDTGNSCKVIVFIRQLDLELVWKFKKVTQRSMSNLSKILCREHPYKVTTWYRQSLKSYRRRPPPIFSLRFPSKLVYIKELKLDTTPTWCRSKAAGHKWGPDGAVYHILMACICGYRLRPHNVPLKWSNIYTLSFMVTIQI